MFDRCDVHEAQYYKHIHVVPRYTGDSEETIIKYRREYVFVIRMITDYTQ